MQQNTQSEFRHLDIGPSKTVLGPIVGAKNALQETAQVRDVPRAHFYVFMMAVLGPVWRGRPFGQPVQMPARLYVHHIVTCPLQKLDKAQAEDFQSIQRNWLSAYVVASPVVDFAALFGDVPHLEGDGEADWCLGCASLHRRKTGCIPYLIGFVRSMGEL